MVLFVLLKDTVFLSGQFTGGDRGSLAWVRRSDEKGVSDSGILLRW